MLSFWEEKKKAGQTEKSEEGVVFESYKLKYAALE